MHVEKPDWWSDEDVESRFQITENCIARFLNGAHDGIPSIKIEGLDSAIGYVHPDHIEKFGIALVHLSLYLREKHNGTKAK